VSEVDARRLQRRYLILRASRWFPTGLIIPVFVLYLVDQGLSYGQIGIVTAAQGLMVLILELPTGGLADAIGRRRMLLVANMFELVSVTMILLAPSPAWFVVAFAIQGIYRALESGPLDAWFVDGVHRADPEGGVERGLTLGGIVIGVALAMGALAGGALVALDPFAGIDALAAPIAVSLGFRVVDTVLLFLLMTEIEAPSGRATVIGSVREVPAIIRSAFVALKGSMALRLLLVAEVTWGIGAITWEGLFPARLGELLGVDSAAGVLGPLTAAAWAAAAAGSAVIMWFSRRLGRHRAAALTRLVQAASVVAMGALGGIVGLTIAYLTSFLMLGANGPLHQAMVHDEAEASNRTTITSLNNLCGMAAASLAGILLGTLADASGIPVAMYVGAAVVLIGAPVYYMIGRHQATEPAVAEA
jgi:MFS family permease